MNKKVFVEFIEDDLETLIAADIWKDKQFVAKLFKQKDGDKASFEKNVIEQTSIQTEHWAKVLMFIYRFGRFLKFHCESSFWNGVYRELNEKILKERLNCTIPLGANIGFGTLFKHPFGLIINSKSIIGQNCTIRHNFTIGTIDLAGNKTPSPKIGNNCYIGANVSIFGPIEIGDNSVLGGGAVVTKSFPEGSKLVGVPARNLTAEKEPTDGK